MKLCISVVKIMQKLPFRSLAGEKSPSRSAPEQKTPRSCDRGVSLVGAGNLLGEQDFEYLDGCRGMFHHLLFVLDAGGFHSFR